MRPWPRVAAPDLLRGQGQQQPRGAPNSPGAGRRSRHRLLGRAGPRAGGRLLPRQDRVQWGREDGRRAGRPQSRPASGISMSSRARSSSCWLGSPSRRSGCTVQVGIRVNPDVTTDTHPYISTGKSGIKFGLPTDQVLPAARVHREPPAAGAHHARHASGQPARGHRSRSVRESRRLLELVERLRAERDRHAPGARHRRRAGHPVRRRARAGSGGVRRCRGAAAGADRADRLSRARAISGGQRWRAPHPGAVPEALGRQGVRGGGRRDERSGPAQSLPGVPRDRGAGGAGPIRGAGRRGGTGLRDRRLPGARPHAARRRAPATGWRCWAPGRTASSWHPTTTAGPGRRRSSSTRDSWWVARPQRERSRICSDGRCRSARERSRRRITTAS